MLRGAFALHAALPLQDAMKLVLDRHYPVYPVVDAERRLIGLVRGQTMFEAQAIEISLQAGSMVGVEKEERLATPWCHSLKLRHPVAAAQPAHRLPRRGGGGHVPGHASTGW